MNKRWGGLKFLFCSDCYIRVFQVYTELFLEWFWFSGRILSYFRSGVCGGYFIISIEI